MHEPACFRTVAAHFIAAAIVAATAVAAAGCSQEGFITDRTFDFLANLHVADVKIGGLAVDTAFMGRPRPPWSTDERLFYPASDRLIISYRDVAVGLNPRLCVGFGLSPHGAVRQDTPASGMVRFRIEVGTGGRRETVLDESITPARMQPGEIIERTLAIPDLGAPKCDFFFYSDVGARLESTLPIWRGPILLSDGRAVSAEEAAVAFYRPDSLLLDTPADPGNQSAEAFRADFDEETRLFVPKKDGRLLIQAVPNTAVFRAQAPAADRSGTRLTFGIAASGVDGQPSRDEVVFEVAANREPVFKKTIATASGAASSRISVPLALEGAEPVLVELKTSYASRSAGSGTAAVWINPVIETSRRAARQKAGRAPNVLLIVVDTLRADHVSAYGYERQTTPNLDRLAESGVVFENAFAQSSWTVPSTATLLTGQYSYTHGLYDVNHWHLVPGIATISQAFQQAGLSTTAFVANHLIAQDNNFSAGFETFHTIPHCTAAQLNRAFLNWLDSREEERFFAYLHYMDPHTPYTAPGVLNRFEDPPAGLERGLDLSERIIRYFEEQTQHDHDLAQHESDPAYMRELIGLYDTEIAYWDERFAMMIQELDARRLLDDTIIVVTSDHGEEFGEHGQFRHGQSLHDELLRVPLVFLNAGLPCGRRTDMVGLLDVAPTLLNLAGVRPPSGSRANPIPPFAGHDLFAAKAGRSHLFAETAHASRNVHDTMFVQQAAFSSDWKAILSFDDGRSALFDRKSDPEELRDVGPDHADISSKMADMIDEWVSSCRNAAPYSLGLFDAAALEKLKAMGYIR